MSNEIPPKVDIDLFGNEVPVDVLLRDKFIEPPFSVLDTKHGNWQQRKRRWSEVGIRSEIGRSAPVITLSTQSSDDIKDLSVEYTSIFDPALCELMYHWFAPSGGTVLDPFAGGSVRGIVANYLGYRYTGIELREEQVISNEEQGEEILKGNSPRWICGDSDVVLDTLDGEYDMVFSCPPYADLEVYSDLPEDLSTMEYPRFLEKYRSIIGKTVQRLAPGGYAVFVVGEVRDKDGFYYDFVGDTKRAFIDVGAKLYNDAVLLNSIASASMRTKHFEKSRKLVKIHQNVLVFKKT